MADLDYHLQLLFPLLHHLYFTVGDYKYLIFDKAISIGKYNKYSKQFRFSKIESFLNVLFTINNHVWPKESTRTSSLSESTFFFLPFFLLVSFVLILS